MKILKLLTYSLLAVFMFTACEDDDFNAAETTYTSNEQVAISFTDTNDGMSVLEDGGTVTYTVSLSQALPFDGTVVFNLTSSDGSLETTSGVTEVNYTESVVIPAGSTSASVTLTFADDTISDVSETYSLSINDFETTNTQINYYITNGDDAIRAVNVIDSLPNQIFTTTGDVIITLNWSTSEDLDLYLRDEPGFFTSPNIATSWYDQPETMTMSSTLADGDYFIYAENYDGNYPQACDLTLTFPDSQTEMLLDTLEEGTWFQITKSTSGTDATYTITQL